MERKQFLKEVFENMTDEEKVKYLEMAFKSIKINEQKVELEKIKHNSDIRKIMLQIANQDDFKEPEWSLAEGNPDIIEFRNGEDCFGVIKVESLILLVEEYFKNFNPNRIINRIFNRLFKELVDNERASLSSYIKMSIECPSDKIKELVYSDILFNDDGRFHQFIKIKGIEYVVYYNHGGISDLLFL